MSNPQSCQPCCSTTTPVNTPGVAGADGADGADGSNGVSAYTETDADFVVPSVGGTVNVSLLNSTWMVVGQKIFVGGSIDGATGTGGGYFTYTADLGANDVELTFLGYEDDVAPLTTFDSGAGVSPGGTQPSAITSSRLSDYKNVDNRDDAHTFSETIEPLSFSGSPQALVINDDGLWMVIARVRVDYSFATYGADNKTLNFKLRRTNNSAADVANTTVAVKLRDVTTAYFTANVVELPVAFYNTQNTDDSLSIYGWLDSGDLPTNDPDGRIVALEASLVAVKISEAT